MRLSHIKLANIQAKLHPDFWVNSIQFITNNLLNHPSKNSIRQPKNKANHSPQLNHCITIVINRYTAIATRS